MEALISGRVILRQSIFSRLSMLDKVKNPTFSYSYLQRWSSKSNNVAIYWSTSETPDPDASTYGGWDEMELLEENDESGKLELYRSFLLSLGIDSRKHVLPFLLGLFAALALSRVRFSTIAVLPIMVLVFFGGFISGAAQAGLVVNRLRRNGGPLGAFVLKLKELEGLFSALDGKMTFLMKEFEGRFIADEVGMEASEGYLQTVEHTKIGINLARKTLRDSLNEDFLNGLTDFDFEPNKVNQKPSKKRVELCANDIDFFQFLAGMLHEYLIGSKETKSKNTNKEKVVQSLNPVEGWDPTFLVSDRRETAAYQTGIPSRNRFNNFDQKNSKAEESGIPSNDKQRKTERKVPGKKYSINSEGDYGDFGINDATTGGEYDFRKCRLGSSMFSFLEELDEQSSSLYFMRSHRSFEVDYGQNHEVGAFSSYFHDSARGSTAPKRSKSVEHLIRESKSSFTLDNGLDIQDMIFKSSCRSEIRKQKDQQIDGFNLGEDTAALGNHPSLGNGQPASVDGEDKKPYSSNTPIDESFEYKLNEAVNLIKYARKYMLSQANEEKADAILYKAAELLSAAVVMKPMSSVAVGQLGNTYLLHGELKLKVSQELRTLLSKTGTMFSGKSSGLWFRKIDCIATNREDIASALVSVCEECEGLLVEAGIRYRRALLIDGNDIRALYNWGLALCFHAQLIADVGTEAAVDADKLYLAAIDKFNAMMTRSNAYAPDALFRWGVALQQRSRLRAENSRERARFLQQAKSLFEDALAMDSGNPVVRNALVSCVSELNYNQL